VRGGRPTDAVVMRHAGGTVDLAPTLGDVDAGRYSAELRRWTSSGPAEEATTLALIWRPSGAVARSGGTVAVGLYQLTLLDRVGEVTGRALVLVTPEANFEALHEAFERARWLTESWAWTTGEAGLRRFLAEYLLALEQDPELAAATR
jgi:hypothetical protein